MRFRKPEVRRLPFWNFCFLVFLLSLLLFHFILNISDGIARSLIHLPSQAKTGCNGHPDLCTRKYSNITQIGTHGSPFSGILPMANQNVDIKTQLDSGIRFLQAQTHHNAFGTLSLCHTSCMINNAGSLQNYLKVVKDWLDAHPLEIVTLAYVPKNTGDWKIDDSINSWPTLGEMIASGKRLVAFVDYETSPLYPHILSEFLFFWETPFDSTDPAFSQCTIQRIVAATNPQMYIINHFLDTQIFQMTVPNRKAASHTNAAAGAGSIGAQVQLCKELHGNRVC